MTLTNRATLLFHRYALGTSHDLPEDNRNAAIFFAIVMPMGCGSLQLWIVFYLLYDPATLWPPALACALGQVGLAAPWIARRSRFGAEVFVTAMVCALFTVLMWLFGSASGLNYGLLAVAMVLAMEIGTHRPVPFVICAGAPLFFYFALPLWFPRTQPVIDASPWLLGTISFSNQVNLVLVTALALAVILRRTENAEAALAREYDRSEALLANLVPAQIAARLKDNPGKIIADENAAVTILFADIAGFTPKAAQMSPEALVAYLNRVFSTFDTLTARYGLEKIKTIGDAYMVAAGLPEPRGDHAQAAADMALEMLVVAARLSAETGEPVDLRIGLQSGPAVGGVIGTTKVFYDVWGDTVNTAARMESHGAPGRIQVTAATRTALGAGYVFTPRGVMDVKGVGSTETWWLTGKA